MPSAISAALTAAWPGLVTVARAAGSTEALVERDFQRTLEDVTGRRSAPISLARWPGVGPVDLMLPGSTAVELKWCKGGDTLANCSWDVAKLASAVAEGQALHAYIAAGAPAAHWRSGAQGARLFDTRRYGGDELVREYERWWRSWCADVETRPIQLPTSITVTEDSRRKVDLAGEEYEWRTARVGVEDAKWRAYECPHRWRGDRCGQRPGEPDAPLAVVEVRERPATFATAHEAPWKKAVRDAVGASGVEAMPDRWFKVKLAFRTPVPRTTNDRWDLDNLVKPTLDAMEGVFGLRRWKGAPQPNDDRVVDLQATKRTVASGEVPGATIEVWLASADGSS